MNKRLTFHCDFDAVHRLANAVGGDAHVLSCVLGVDGQNVERRESKVVGGAEAVSSLQRLTIVEPLNLEVGVRVGLNAALEVGALALIQLSWAVQLGDELRSLSHNRLHVLAAVHAGRVLLVLHGLNFMNDRFFGCKQNFIKKLYFYLLKYAKLF